MENLNVSQDPFQVSVNTTSAAKFFMKEFVTICDCEYLDLNVFKQIFDAKI